jgi:hypothetical protein
VCSWVLWFGGERSRRREMVGGGCGVALLHFNLGRRILFYM